MANDVLPIILRGRPDLAKFKARGRAFDWLNYDSLQTFKVEDDFLGDIAVATREPGYDTSTNGTSSAAAALTSGAIGGTCDLVTGTDDNGHSGLYLGGGGHFSGDNNPRMTARIKVDAITSVKIEVGFTDATSDAGAINALDTPTITADNCCVAIFDTDATEDNWQFAGGRATVPWSDATVDVAPVAATYQWITVALNRVDLATDNMDAYLYIDGVLKATKRLGAIANATVLYPYILVQARAGAASRTLTCDYFGAWADRSVGGLGI